MQPDSLATSRDYTGIIPPNTNTNTNIPVPIPDEEDPLHPTLDIATTHVNQQEEHPHPHSHTPITITPQNTNNTTHSRIRSATPWYLSHSLFLAILMVRLLRPNNAHIIPWWLVFSPIFLSAMTILLLKVRDSYLLFTTRHETNNSTQASSFRVHCALVDHTGYTMTIVMACLYLETSLIPSIALVCSPLLITAIMSLIHRLINLPSLNSRTIGRLFISSFFNCVLHTLVRIIQPLLLVLKLDSYMDNISWTIVAIPTWILCFTGVIAMTLLLYFSCVLHVHANVILRIHASQLMLLCAFQLMVVSLCTFLSSYWLTTSLDEETPTFIGVKTYLGIFLPLVVMCVTIAICYPITLSKSTRYHELLFASTQMFIAMQSTRHVTLEPLEEPSTWLIQESESLFRLTTLPDMGIDTATELKMRQCLKSYEGVVDDVGLEEGASGQNTKVMMDIETGLCNADRDDEKLDTVNKTQLQLQSLALSQSQRQIENNNTKKMGCDDENRDVCLDNEDNDDNDDNYRDGNIPVELKHDQVKDEDRKEEKEEEEEEDTQLSLSSSSSSSATLGLVDLVIDKQFSLLSDTNANIGTITSNVNTDAGRPFGYSNLKHDHENDDDKDNDSTIDSANDSNSSRNINNKEAKSKSKFKSNSTSGPESESDGHMCIICYDNPANACFMTCGHGNVCYTCALAVARKPPSQCPICRLEVKQVLKLTQYVDIDIDVDVNVCGGDMRSVLSETCHTITTTTTATAAAAVLPTTTGLECDDVVLKKSTLVGDSTSGNKFGGNKQSPDIVIPAQDITTSSNTTSTAATASSNGVTVPMHMSLKEGARLVLSEEGVSVVSHPYHPYHHHHSQLNQQQHLPNDAAPTYSM